MGECIQSLYDRLLANKLRRKPLSRLIFTTDFIRELLKEIRSLGNLLEVYEDRLEFIKEKNMPSTTIQFFTWEHLPKHLQEVSKPLAEVAHLMEDTLPDGPEKSAGMRKLLEAKDCFVRAALDKKEWVCNNS